MASFDGGFHYDSDRIENLQLPNDRLFPADHTDGFEYNERQQFESGLNGRMLTNVYRGDDPHTSAMLAREPRLQDRSVFYGGSGSGTPVPGLLDNLADNSHYCSSSYMQPSVLHQHPEGILNHHVVGGTQNPVRNLVQNAVGEDSTTEGITFRHGSDRDFSDYMRQRERKRSRSPLFDDNHSQGRDKYHKPRDRYSDERSRSGHSTSRSRDRDRYRSDRDRDRSTPDSKDSSRRTHGNESEDREHRRKRRSRSRSRSRERNRDRRRRDSERDRHRGDRDSDRSRSRRDRDRDEDRAPKEVPWVPPPLPEHLRHLQLPPLAQGLRQTSRATVSPPVLPQPPAVQNQFQNDGSFMEMFRKQMEAKAMEQQSGSLAAAATVAAAASTTATDTAAAGKQAEATSGTVSATLPSATPTSGLPVIAKRRISKILKTGVVHKPKPVAEPTVSEGGEDGWSRYMNEVQKYRANKCIEDESSRPLMK